MNSLMNRFLVLKTQKKTFISFKNHLNQFVLKNYLKKVIKNKNGL